MTQAETLLHDALSSAAALADLAGRFHALLRPAAEPVPCVVYGRNATSPVNNLTGNNGLDSVVMDVTSWAASYAEAKALAAKVRRAISADAAARGVMLSDLDEYDENVKLFGVKQTYRIWQRA